jgi:hypothetical protein
MRFFYEASKELEAKERKKNSNEAKTIQRLLLPFSICNYSASVFR